MPNMDLLSYYKLITTSNYFELIIKDEKNSILFESYEKSIKEPSKSIIVDFLNKLHYHSLFLKTSIIDINSLEKKKLLLIDKVKCINENIFIQIVPQIQLSTTQLVQAIYNWRLKLEDHKRVYLQNQENVLFSIQIDMVLFY